MLTENERQELEMLRNSAANFMTDPLEKRFFELEKLIDNPSRRATDSMMPTNAFYTLTKATMELKRDYMEFKKEMTKLLETVENYIGGKKK